MLNYIIKFNYFFTSIILLMMAFLSGCGENKKPVQQLNSKSHNLYYNQSLDLFNKLAKFETCAILVIKSAPKDKKSLNEHYENFKAEHGIHEGFDMTNKRFVSGLEEGQILAINLLKNFYQYSSFLREELETQDKILNEDTSKSQSKEYKVVSRSSTDTNQSKEHKVVSRSFTDNNFYGWKFKSEIYDEFIDSDKKSESKSLHLSNFFATKDENDRFMASLNESSTNQNYSISYEYADFNINDKHVNFLRFIDDGCRSKKYRFGVLYSNDNKTFATFSIFRL